MYRAKASPYLHPLFKRGIIRWQQKSQIYFPHHMQGLTCPSVLLTVGNSILLEDQGLRPELEKTGADLTHHMHKSQHPSPTVRNRATPSNLLLIVTQKRHTEGQDTYLTTLFTFAALCVDFQTGGEHTPEFHLRVWELWLLSPPNNYTITHVIYRFVAGERCSIDHTIQFLA